jgi:TFIIF-interacting CTD phosphatase-like protein
VYVKDLMILLEGRHLEDMVIIDNKMESYASNLENGIPITDYLGQDEDEMLEILERYLLKMQYAQDVREVIVKDFFMGNLSDLRREHAAQ